MASHRYPRDLFGEVGVPDLGMDTDTVPRMMSSRKAQLVKNFLMDRPGVLPMRGPLCEGTTWNAGASIGLVGLWTYDDKVLISQAVPSGGGTNFDRDYWVAPYRKAAVFNDLRELTMTPRVIDFAAGSTTAFVPTTITPGLKSARVGLFVYGPAAWDAAAAVVTQDGYVYFSSKLIRWDGTTAGLVAYTHGPKIAQDVAYHYNRLFVLGGIAEGGAKIEFNSLYWSDFLPTDGTALPDTAAAWQDDVSGLVNRIVVGTDDPNDFGVAFAHVGPNLCILKRRSIWMLYGTSSSNFQVKQVSNEVGCTDPRSVVEYNGGVYFMSERGFMFYDGVRTQRVSPSLSSTLEANTVKQVGTQGVDGGYVRATVLDRGYILVTTGVYGGNTLTAAADTDAWLLHAPTGAWTQLSSGALTSVIGGGRTTNNTYLITDQKFVKANYLFNPSAAPAGTRGFDSIDSGATKFIIPSRWTTRALELAAPTSKSKLQRIMAEYYWGLANGGWTVTATTRGATGVANPSAVLGAPTTVAATLPARGTVPVFNETDEVYFEVAATSSAPAAFNDAELHRLLVEYEPTGNTVPV